MSDDHDLRAHEDASSPPAEQRFAWYRDRVLMLTIPAVFLLDQVSKQLIKTFLPYGQSWPSDGAFRFTHVTNSGAAFGFFTNATPALVVASLIAIGFLVYFYRTHAAPRPILRLAIGLQMGGALGNLIDRLSSGSVVDFIDVAWWPVFNVADSSIVVGMFILVGILVFAEQASPSSPVRDPEEPSEDGP
ncbi:MAG: signal peptidase II [Chloroflexi bacterium]|nr:signal peptidase II [Chloroflexota bacterium]